MCRLSGVFSVEAILMQVHHQVQRLATPKGLPDNRTDRTVRREPGNLHQSRQRILSATESSSTSGVRWHQLIHTQPFVSSALIPLALRTWLGE